MNNWSYAVKDRANLCKNRDFHIISKGKSLHSDVSLSDYIEQGYEILDTASFRELWRKCWQEYETELCGKWKEITRKRYEDALNCLPPLLWTNGGFFLSEMYDECIGYFFQEWRGKYYESMQNVKRVRNDILHELQECINNGNVESE